MSIRIGHGEVMTAGIAVERITSVERRSEKLGTQPLTLTFITTTVCQLGTQHLTLSLVTPAVIPNRPTKEAIVKNLPRILLLFHEEGQNLPRRHSIYCLLPTTYCLLPTPYCLLPTPYCLLPIACLS